MRPWPQREQRVKDDTCEVECGGWQGHRVRQGVERSAVLQPDHPDWVRRSVGHTAQAQGYVGHYGHVLGLHGEVRKAWERIRWIRVSTLLTIQRERACVCSWRGTHPPAGCSPPQKKSGGFLTEQHIDRSPCREAGPSQYCMCVKTVWFDWFHRDKAMTNQTDKTGR